MKRQMGLVLLLGIILLTGCSTSQNEITLTDDDNGSMVTASLNQTIIITLPSNPTTGYSWNIFQIDTAQLNQVGETEFIPENEEPLVGQGGAEKLQFLVIAEGKSTLILVYHRPWEEGVEPLETFSIEIVVE